MKVKRLCLIMQMMLISCSLSLVKANNDTILSTGEITKSDTTIAVPINNIRLANAKMIERLYLLDVVNMQDSMLVLKDKKIYVMQNQISDYKEALINEEKVSNKYRQKYSRLHRRTKTFGYVLAGVVSALVTGLIIK